MKSFEMKWKQIIWLFCKLDCDFVRAVIELISFRTLVKYMLKTSCKLIKEGFVDTKNESLKKLSVLTHFK